MANRALLILAGALLMFLLNSSEAKPYDIRSRKVKRQDSLISSIDQLVPDYIQATSDWAPNEYDTEDLHFMEAKRNAELVNGLLGMNYHNLARAG